MTKNPLRFDVYDAACPTRQVLDRIADKWTALVVGSLAERTRRFGELRREVGGVSHKMLSQTLRSLEQDGLVRRRIYAEVPARVEYSLTPLGRTLIVPLAAVRQWAETYIEQVQAAQARYGATARAAVPEE